MCHDRLDEPHGGYRHSYPFSIMVNSEYRVIKDMIASIVGHGLATRFPDIRFMPVENGSSWVRPMIEHMNVAYDHSPLLFEEHPVDVLKRNVWVHPFHEEDPRGLIKLVGADRVVFGSDYPHPEGMSDPVTYVKELEGLPHPDIARIMGGNLADVMKVPLPA